MHTVRRPFASQRPDPVRSIDRSRRGGGGRRGGNMDRGGGGGGGGRENSKIRRERLRLRGERKRLVGERGGGATRSVSEGKLASRMADADYESSTSRQPRPVRAATSYTWTRARCEPSRCEMHATLHLRCHQPASPDHVHDLPLLSPFPPRRSITRQSLSINERTLREPPERNFRDIRLSLLRARARLLRASLFKR